MGEVEALPNDSTLLACNAVTQDQAVEIRHGARVLWGVQYHPELDVYEVVGALRRQGDELVEERVAGTHEALEEHACLIAALYHDPEQRDVAWQLGLDEQVTNKDCRLAELHNFIDHLVKARVA